MRHAAIASDHLIASEKRPRQVPDHIRDVDGPNSGEGSRFFIFIILSHRLYSITSLLHSIQNRIILIGAAHLTNRQKRTFLDVE